jgi:hypothetical protein
MKIAETLSIVLSICLSFRLDISVKVLLKQPLHNHTHLFIKAHTKSRAFFNMQAGAQMPRAKSHFAPPPPHGKISQNILSHRKVLFQKPPPPPTGKSLKKAMTKSRTKLYMCTVQAKRSGKLIILCPPHPQTRLGPYAHAFMIVTRSSCEKCNYRPSGRTIKCISLLILLLHRLIGQIYCSHKN